MQRRGNAAYAYCHGFLSGPTSSKGRFLASALAMRGVSLTLLDLNRPDPASLSHEGALSAIHEFWEAAQRDSPGARLCLVGSSFGGWAAASYAHRHPERVHRCLLLCPGFELGSRWESIVGGAEELLAWERDGGRTFRMPHTGESVRIPWRFAADSVRLDMRQTLTLRCPTAIVHGLHDAVVPADVSRRFAARHACVNLCMVDDDHWLCKPASLERIEEAAADVFELPPPADEEAAVGSGTAARRAAERAQPLFEAEQKLVVRDAVALEAALAAAASGSASSAADAVEFVGETMFVDEYFDDGAASLARRGAWLRRRAGRWELKLTADARAAGSTDGVAAAAAEVHRELRGPAAVLRWLRALPVAASACEGAEPDPASRAQSDEPPVGTLHAHEADALLTELLRQRGLTPFAAFGTTRRRWRADGLTIDLDCAWTQPARGADGLATAEHLSRDPFYKVLEVEALGPTAAAASARLERGFGQLLERLGDAVGTSTDVVEGKLVRFVARYRSASAHARLFREYRASLRRTK